MALNGLPEQTRRILERLTVHGVLHAIVGGLAVSARTEPRFTRDVDIAVAVESDPEAERLVRALRADGYVAATLIEQEAMGRIATIRLTESTAGESGPIIDLLFASSGIEHEIVGSADVMELFEGVAAPVATIASLIALKLLARDDGRRPQDTFDLVALARVATTADLAEAGRLCALIGDRGYARGRDLAQAMRAYPWDPG